ncbi:T9SS type B sorting domain-containing protein [Tellurirhabdus rosea]|uniref:T9SS type B sorting domain-containing protein n=1 Tax=Tellurirhabdus rosea TaxID=2674997 RepID=UPI002250B606|nr:gliding motility-associated C-terminal domain-containing protein [Tellurirhabdus rosea]
MATHVRAGEITTRRISNTSLTYEITVTLYFDEVGGRGASETEDDFPLCFGDGTPSFPVPRVERRPINRNTTINIYRTVHTYPGPGTYNLSVSISNRNENTRNIPNSVNTTFELRTTIVVSAPLGLNSTPVMLNPPLDSARVGQKFCHNPAAFDSDGDSLAYRLTVSAGRQSGEDVACRGPQPVAGYIRPEVIGQNPTTEAGAGPATLTIDPRTGDLCWDAPAERGQYNIAFIIEEYRDGIKIGEIVRDIQIVVVEGPNRRPELRVPDDLCVEAGTIINQAITATDPDGNRLQLSAFGGPFNVGPDGRPYTDPTNNQPINIIAPPFATFNPRPDQTLNSPATGTFRWQTACAHVREEPYDVVIRAVDLPARGQTQLATLESFRIRVYAPRPQNLTARPGTGRATILTWSAYACGVPGAEMVIYRREGCTTLATPPCSTGIGATAGYTEIGRVPITATTFTDTDPSLRRGASYSYRLVAAFPRPRGGESVVSNEACLALPLQVPLMTNVTVDSTDATRGRITVRWTRPIGLGATDVGGPFQYRLFRAPGLTATAGNDFVQIAAIEADLSGTRADTVYVDRGLNTSGGGYRYRVEFYYTEAGTGALTRLDVTDAASSVVLAAAGELRRVRLSWQAVVPWDNTNQRHRVYRSVSGPNGPFNRIAEVAVQGPNTFTFTDTGSDSFAGDGVQTLTLSPDSVYCYRVETVGVYTNPAVSLRPQNELLNYSQAVCASPIDTTRPCPPRLSLDSLDCATLSGESACTVTTFTNTLSWQGATTGPNNQPCDTRIASYNVYYSRYQEDTEHQRLTGVPAPTTSFAHTNLSSVAGCYYVTAVTRGGVESAPSNRVCKDICPVFELPNVFTPNGDGKNDVFVPLPCPAGVVSVQFVVYNRFGGKVFETSDVNINWSGRTSGGQELSAGLYYYQASVRFGGVNRNGSVQVYKGWVQLMRESNTK